MAKILGAITIVFLVLLWIFNSQSKVLTPIRIPLAASFISLDPTLVMDQSSLWVSRQLNCQLVRYDGAEVVNDAAESVSYLTDTQIEVRLRHNIFFSDGSPVTAPDVVATFSFLKSSRKIHRNIFDWVKDIEVKSPLTFVFHLKSPTPQFMKTLAAPIQTIFPESFIKRVKATSAEWNYPIGCGGYKLNRRFTDSSEHQVIELLPIQKESHPIHFVLTGTNQVPASDSEKYDLIGIAVVGDKSKLSDQFKSVDLFDPYQIYFSLNTQVKPWHQHEKRCHLLNSIDSSPLINAYEGAESPTDWFPRGILGYSGRMAFSGAASKVSNQPDNDLRRRFRLAILGVSVPETLRGVYESLFKKVFSNIQTETILDAKRFGKEFLDSGADGLIFGLKSGYLDGYELLQFLSEPDFNVTNWRNSNFANEIKMTQDIPDSTLRAKAYQSIASKIESECLGKPLLTLLRRKVYFKKTFQFPKIGRYALNTYFLGAVR